MFNNDIIEFPCIWKQWQRRRIKGVKKIKKVTKQQGKKSPKSSVNALVSLVQGIEDDSDIIGTATLRFNMDGSFLLALDMGGLTSDGTVIITDDNSCDNLNGIPFTDTRSDGIGQLFDGTTNAYAAFSEGGISQSAFRFNNGYSRNENLGKAVLIYYDSDPSNAVACGILESEQKSKILTADIGLYPGYDGDLNPLGRVTVSFRNDDTFRFHYHMVRLEANCVECGIHIHAGTSCDTDEEVKGHGWNTFVVQDLWTTAGGATYSTDSMGNARGYFELFNGYGFEENYHHAVVVHLQDGARAGCGLLKWHN